jgi:hypothetical protein
LIHGSREVRSSLLFALLGGERYVTGAVLNLSGGLVLDR